jgi:hypothetical protein
VINEESEFEGYILIEELEKAKALGGRDGGTCFCEKIKEL